MVSERQDVESLLEEVKLTRLTVDAFKDLLVPLKKMWSSVKQLNSTMELDPDFESYRALQESNVWFLFSAEYKDTISLFSFFIQPSLHIKSTKYLTSDFIYVDPKHRGKGVADILLLAAEDQAKKEGVHIMSIVLKNIERHDTLNIERHDSLTNRLGYSMYENNFQKVI